VQWSGGRPQPVPPIVLATMEATRADLDIGARASMDEQPRDILVAVNTDPLHPQETMVHVPIQEMGIDHEQAYVVEDLLTGARYTWRGVRNYVRLDPAMQPGHVFLVHPVEARP
jgi:hypothetical protein